VEERRILVAVSPHHPFITTKLDEFVHWAQASSIWPMTMGLACCAIEMMSIVSPKYDVARFGAEKFSSSPRQSDLMIVSGRVANKMVPVIKQLFDQMPDPKWVISMGACASSGGVFDNYAVVPCDTFLPVDVYVPGCPPSPDALIYAIMQIRKQIEAGGKTNLLVPNA
jgi:NADH-quinone oxidoreductase subunit B